MKIQFKQLFSTLCLFYLLSGFNQMAAATTPQIEALFNWAEATYPNYFPESQVTQEIDPWSFRVYSTGIYLGVSNGEVYVFGGVFGTASPTYVDTLANLLVLVNGSDVSGSSQACETNDLPEGMVITENGNTVNITTNGQCIAMPENQTGNFCSAPDQPTATGISVLSSTNTTSFQTTGLVFDVPGFPDPLQSMQDSLSSTTCTMNVPAENADFVVNSDVCLDVTNQFSGFTSIPGVTLTPPVTIAYAGTTTGQIVADCFATDATVVSDAFTGEAWIRGTDGNFVQVTF